MSFNLFREKSILDEIVLDWGSTENSINEIDVKKESLTAGNCVLVLSGPMDLKHWITLVLDKDQLLFLVALEIVYMVTEAHAYPAAAG